MRVLHFYCDFQPGSILKAKLEKFRIYTFRGEICYNVELTSDCKGLTESKRSELEWILSTPFAEQVRPNSTLTKHDENSFLIEIGPRLNFSTAFSTNAVSICQSVGILEVERIETSFRYYIPKQQNAHYKLSDKLEVSLVELLHDKMTQCRYLQPIENFDLSVSPEEVYEVDIINKGRKALEDANAHLGLAFDDWDLDYYTDLFREKVKRNPTSVECFDLAQSNSEHSRHWFFKGRMVVNKEDQPQSLFSMVMSTQEHSNQNNVIKFCDNSSAITGYPVKVLYPNNSHMATALGVKNDITRHVIFTAETHNFPTGVAPFPGATTGTGGRIRDVHAAGRGAHVIAGTAGYSFGNLNIPGYDLPWEEKFTYPSNFAPPLEVAIEASNGASDYGNKFGEPVLTGFARSFGMLLPSGERREYVKPIMFSGGIGALDHLHTTKMTPEIGMEVVKLGGPVYRIGVGGGAASSIQVQGDNTSDLDFGAVQRGDAEMEQKLNRVIRACIEMGEDNPICSIHDQGAGGNGNVLKEICEPTGAHIKASRFQLGDPTLSILELWGAEYQESTAVLVHSTDSTTLQKIGNREKCPVCFVGSITGDGKIKLEDDRTASKDPEEPVLKKAKVENFPVDLELDLVLGNMPRKTFNLTREARVSAPLSLPPKLAVQEALGRVLRLPSVASKRYLTNKVDRSVTGLVAQQQCVGPLHTPLADVAVVALSHLDTVGGATAIGEQPIKGLVDPERGARMTVGEALTNLVFAKITDLKDVKCSGNWMWPAKLPGEGAQLYDTCRAMCDIMKQLGVAVDGGKDSLSMAARVGENTVKAPGTLVISVYAACPDIRLTLTPDLKCPQGKGCLLYIPLSPGNHRLGGSALAQCFKQLGDDAPNLEDPDYFSKGFSAVQKLIKDGLLSAGHDVSDGGLITCILEMAFAGNCSINVDLPTMENASVMEILFAEELGLILETSVDNKESVLETFTDRGIQCHDMGTSQADKIPEVVISVNGTEILKSTTADLRDTWEETSFQLEMLQSNPDCVKQERENLKRCSAPKYNLTFDPEAVDHHINESGDFKPRVAVIREEGSNGDREMCSAFHMAGFEVWDVNMQDLCSGRTTLDTFQGIVFVGGFSYADVFGSAKGWAGTLKYNKDVKAQFEEFYARSDTFSLGICNGCQLMGLLGWVAPDQSTDSGASQGVHLAHNSSQRFESRFTTVKIADSPSIMLGSMAGSVLGIWVAHGEGRMVFKNEQLLENLQSKNLLPLHYTDDDGHPTESYPHNPNGSPLGVAALCSDDGRHLAMMPHPERCVLPWQWPWMPWEWQQTMKTAPWLQMFKNAYRWCQSHQ